MYNCICMYMYMYVYVYVYVCICICICMYMYMYTYLYYFHVFFWLRIPDKIALYNVINVIVKLIECNVWCHVMCVYV